MNDARGRTVGACFKKCELPIRRVVMKIWLGKVGGVGHKCNQTLILWLADRLESYILTELFSFLALCSVGSSMASRASSFTSRSATRNG